MDAARQATLATCGELGYDNFRRLSESALERYAEAHAAGAEHLAERLIAAGSRRGSWRAGLRAGLNDLGLFVLEEPLLAIGLLVEAQAAAEPVQAQRREMIKRLTRAVDSARRENESRHSPPPIAAEFMVLAIEHSAVAALENGAPEAFAAAVPELAYLTVAPFFGRSAALEDRAALSHP